jgi:uncharacterized protein DUF4276
VIVDGQSEYRALPLVTSKIVLARAQVINPLYAPIPPYAPTGVIANACRSRIDQLVRRGARDIIVLLDREARPECPGNLARTIGDALRLPAGCRGWVVVKNKMFENWLIADIGALRASPQRYQISPALERRIAPNKADSCDALGMLKEVTSHSYSKVQDSQTILAAAHPLKIAENSRSFRRLLRVMGHELYRDQSTNAVRAPDE